MSTSRRYASNSDLSPLFALGRCEVTPAAQAALAGSGVSAVSLFRRHERGDWGDAPEWLGPFNDRAARQGPSDHVIESRYRLDGGPEVRLMTASDRTRTLLLLDAEFQDREVDARTGYAAWAASYDAVANPLIMIEQPVVDALLAGLPPGGTAADVGTGTGAARARAGASGVGRDRV